MPTKDIPTNDMSTRELPSVREEIINNLGFWTVELQHVLEDACIAVAGLGGAGGLVVELLARCGVGNWKIADPDTSETANIGRQAGANYATVGLKKAWISAAAIHSVHRGATVRVYEDGVTHDNIDDFLDGADVVLDAIAIEEGWLSVLLGQRARSRGIPMITSIEVGDGCQYTVLDPNSSDPDGTVEAFFGVDPNEAAHAAMAIGVHSMLSFVPPTFPPELLQALERGVVRTPAHAVGVARNASAVARTMRELLLHPEHDHPFFYPHVVIDDPDPLVGTFRLHHQERASRLQASFAALSQAPPRKRFSTTDEYIVV